MISPGCLCVSTPTVTCGWVDSAMVDSIAALADRDSGWVRAEPPGGDDAGTGCLVALLSGHSSGGSAPDQMQSTDLTIEGTPQRSRPVKKRVRPHRSGRGPYRRSATQGHRNAGGLLIPVKNLADFPPTVVRRTMMRRATRSQVMPGPAVGPCIDAVTVVSGVSRGLRGPRVSGASMASNTCRVSENSFISAILPSRTLSAIT